MSVASAVAAAEALFGESAETEDFVTWSDWALARFGFRPSNCLPLVALCRDELMASVEDAIEATWGHAFQVGSLAGIVLAGRTGLQAALGHVPGEDGRHRFAAFCLPHIGIDAHGQVGRVVRRGMHRDSSACGALVGAGQVLERTRGHLAHDPDDFEMSALCSRLAMEVGEQAVPGLDRLTELTRRAAVADLRRYIGLVAADEPIDVAYLSGIVVHLPDGSDRIAGVHGEVVIDGVSHALPH